MIVPRSYGTCIGRNRAWQAGVFHLTLIRIQDRIQQRLHVVTQHARREVDDDGILLWDLEHAILSGKIIERRWDQETH